MKLLDVMNRETIIADLASTDKKGILEEMAEPAAKKAGISRDDCVRVLLERERLGSTGIGEGIGIPHGKMSNLDNLILGFGRSLKGIDFDSMDGHPTHLFFLLITPENSTGLHLKVLARISKILKNSEFKSKLLSAKDRDEIFDIIEEEDQDF